MDDISNLKRKYIVLKVRNPNEYIDREPTRSKKRSLELLGFNTTDHLFVFPAVRWIALLRN